MTTPHPESPAEGADTDEPTEEEAPSRPTDGT
jgi:hypothetical protein